MADGKAQDALGNDRTGGPGTVAKALEVLDAVAAHPKGVRFSELQITSRYPKATLYRLVQTLVKEGMLVLNPETNIYTLGVRLVRLAHAAWGQSSLAPIARPHLDRLSAALSETVHLAQLDHGQVLYVDKRNAAETVEMYSQAGKVGPAYCTGVGKVLLAYLEPDALEQMLPQQSFHRFTSHTLTDRNSLSAELAAIRARGYGFDREEHEPGIICVAMPVLTASGRCLAALSVTGLTARVSLAALEEHVPLMRAAAQRIADDAQAWRFPDSAQR
ncbi:IclR family transcriptional regulator [Pseudoruegeria sp. SK021]|nr:IclR family transcriptional regulator [Pseudoruegeria sp. SK021]